MKSLVSENRTSIIFESKRRIKDFLVDLEGLCPGRKVFIAREMTKLHETFYRGEINKVISEISLDENSLKGEFVIVVEGIKEVKKEILLTNDQVKVLEIILEKMKKKEALSLASKVFGIKKNSLYKFVLEQK